MEITQVALLLCKLETGYLNDATPTGVNAIPTLDESVTWDVKSTPLARNPGDGTMDALPGYNTQRWVELKFKYELRGNYVNGGTSLDISNGTSAQAVEIDCLLQAANLAPVYTAATTPGSQGISAGSRDGKVIYTPTFPITDEGKSVTCYWYTGLKKHGLKGGKVDANFVFEAGKIPYVEFTVSGHYIVTTDASLPSPTFLACKPPITDGATFIIDSGNAYPDVLSKMTFALGNKVTNRITASSGDANQGFVITSYDPKGTYDPETLAQATHPIWADWKASRTFSIQVQCASGGTGNSITVTADATELKKVNMAARNNVRIHNVEFNILRSALGVANEFHLQFS